MKKIVLRNAKNKKITPNLVRFFKFKDAYYLIYTFHEKDEKNFVKLYVLRILEELGKPIASYLETDWEWEEIQEIIKQMLRELKKNNVVSFKDLNPNGIQGLKIQEPRSFKLSETLVEILSGDKVVTVTQESMNEQKPKQEENTAHLDSFKQAINQTRENPQKLANNILKEPLSVQKELSKEFLEKSKEEKTASDKIALQESLENAVMTELAYHKLQQENENLKKQLLQYQIKYQALKDLLTKDE